MTIEVLRSRFVLVIGLLLICVSAIGVESRLRVLHHAYDRFVLDNRNHYLSCADLPVRTDVERVVEQHMETIQQIRQVDPDFVGVEIDGSDCQGKADLLIWYGTREHRTAIERIMQADTFFGIPYRLQNR